MKRTALTILLSVMTSASASAQSAYDAWLLSENNYEGTARSVAMGNAFTALGGDLGAVSINPAGSAVAGYSQFTLTPSLTFATNIASGAPFDNNPAPYFQNKTKSRMTDLGLSNLGFSFNFDTGRKTGFKSFTFGFIINRSNSWLEDMYTSGTNRETSFLAAAAADAQAELEWMNNNKAPNEADFTSSDFLSSNAFDYMNWKDVVGYRSGMFSAIDADGKKFAGATEIVYDGGEHMLAGEVNQAYGKMTSGNKNEYLFNFGGNISDFVYVGFNLGINTLNYDYSYYFKESAVNAENFENVFVDQQGVEHITYFDRAKYQYDYNVDGTGVFAKLGVIVTPGNGLRFGAAIQTPTSTTIKESWQEGAETRFTDSSFNGESESDRGNAGYRFNAPWRANFGIAYTLGKLAVISADYEIADYRSMKYKFDRHESADSDIEHFESLNDDISNRYGAAHYLRAGLEIKPLSSLAVRCGYNLASSALIKEYDPQTDEYFSMDRILRHNIAFGLGYSSKKSFFADLACRYSLPENEYIIPYSDYLASINGALPPEILNRHSNWKVLLTLGWRF